MARLLIPTALRQLTGGASEVSLTNCATVRASLELASARHEGLTKRLLDDRGELRRFVNIFLGEDNIRDLDGLDTPVRSGDEIAIVLAIAGGRQ
jgi:molybdopterin converting factor small subunit